MMLLGVRHSMWPRLLAVIAGSLIIACSGRDPDPPKLSHVASASSVSQMLGGGAGIIQAGGGIIGGLCTEATGNYLGSLFVDVFTDMPDVNQSGSELCTAATVPGAADPNQKKTVECTDYCETRSPSVSNWQDFIGTALNWAGFATYLPPSVWAQIYNLLMNPQSPEWTMNNTQAALLHCATMIGWAASEYYFSKKACDRGSQCVTCDDTSTTFRNGCLVGQTLMWCAQDLGFQPPPALAALSASCSIGRLCNKGIVLEGCRRACGLSLAYASPIAQPVVNDAGVTSRTCCTCDRQTWEDWPLILGGDVLMSQEYYYSPVSDYPGPVPECEGKSGTTTEAAGRVGPGGYPVYYYYNNCHKVTFNGQTCPADHGYHAPGSTTPDIGYGAGSGASGAGSGSGSGSGSDVGSGSGSGSGMGSGSGSGSGTP